MSREVVSNSRIRVSQALRSGRPGRGVTMLEAAPGLSSGSLGETGEGEAGRLVIKMQPWQTLFGQTSGDTVVQPREGWLDASANRSFMVFVEITGVSGCTVNLETAMGSEGPWAPAATFTSATVAGVVLSSEGTQASLREFVRWKVTSSGANWKTCFRMEATPNQ